MGADTRINDKPWRDLYSLVRKAGSQKVRVGIFTGELAEIGAIHEYGAPRANIPARPWMRATFSSRREELIALQRRLAQLFLAKKIDEKRYLELLGAWIVAQMKATIAQYGPILFQPLQPATIRAKGGKTAPLINTGQMLNAITFIIVA
jgi:hypothetical protein